MIAVQEKLEPQRESRLDTPYHLVQRTEKDRLKPGGGWSLYQPGLWTKGGVPLMMLETVLFSKKHNYTSSNFFPSNFKKKKKVLNLIKGYCICKLFDFCH